MLIPAFKKLAPVQVNLSDCIAMPSECLASDAGVSKVSLATEQICFKNFTSPPAMLDSNKLH
jgi:hypothetical protein